MTGLECAAEVWYYVVTAVFLTLFISGYLRQKKEDERRWRERQEKSAKRK